MEDIEFSPSQKKIIRKWIAALRSGEYKQGRHRLKRIFDNGICQHCCLGVLAETVGMNFENGIITDSNGIQNTHSLDPCLCAEFDLTWLHNFSYDENGEYSPVISILIDMNDNTATTFNEIADWVEENLLE